MRRILFSPVGGTDPISMNNYHDGSMLHIIRYYHPDIVFLYMSEEIYRNHLDDNRYIYCIEKLCKQDGVEVKSQTISLNQLNDIDLPETEEQSGFCHCIIIRDDQRKDVYEYNVFIDEFSREIHSLQQQMTDTDELLLNVSSGTPAMKSALLVLSTMLNYNCRMIQVTTPARAMNEHSHRGYDVEFLWEADEDNEKEDNRCHEVNFRSLALVKYKNLLQNLLLKYDYSGAVDVCESIKKLDPEFDDRPIRMAEQRNLLNIPEARKIAKDLNMDICPVKSGDNMMLFEYAANLFIKAKKNEYADFIRGMTPLILPLCERILKTQTPNHIDIQRYTRLRTNRNGLQIRKWDQELLAGTEIDNVLNSEFVNFRYDDIFSVHIVKLIDHFCSNWKVIELTDSIRDIESNIRNLAAHEIVSVTPQRMRNLTGHSIEECVKMIKEAFSYTDINVRHEYWNTYDEMNRKIISALQNS